ncbi:flagellar hook-length control protein FliK [Vreelandella titanicae]|uniref:flagellar hook-length control protein FliK n=1 Tax=Vreelandella titanicae TaxID=664683 RepID=UPI0039BF308E
MNIHQLLSVNQNSPQTQSQGTFGQQDTAKGVFHQTLLQASGTQRLSASAFSEAAASHTPRSQAQLNELSSLLSDASADDVENLHEVLQTLGLDVSERDLSELLAQLQQPSSEVSLETLGLDAGEASTPLDEIAGRLALMASFTENRPELASPAAPATLEAIAEQLNISQSEAAQLVDSKGLKTIAQYLSMDKSGPGQSIDPAALEAIADQLNINQTDAAQPIVPAELKVVAEQLNISQTEATQLVDSKGLKTIAQYLSIDESGSGQPIDPATLEVIAEQLNISQTEAAQLASTLNALAGQLQSTSPRSAESAQLTNTRSPVAELQAALRPQPDTFFTQINTGNAAQQANSPTAATQISSEALMSALLTGDGASKASPSSEHLLTGLSLNTGSSPLATSQSTQGFSPNVTPTAATLATPVNSPAWPQQLSQQLVQISQRGGEQHVQMQLNPAELGPLSISLKFGEQGAQAHFLSAHAQVRQVLEQAIPQLREALAEQGISLGETSVGEQRDPNEQAFAQSGGKQGAEAGSGNGDIGLDESLTQSTERSPLRLDGRVDLYA